MDISKIRDGIRGIIIPGVIAFALVIIVSSPAAAQQYQQYKIVDIQVSGNVNSSETMIKNIAAFPLGGTLKGTEVQGAVKSLYAQGIFRDISVEIEPVTAGIIIHIKVSEYPQLTSIKYDGNDKIKDKDLEELLRLAPGGFISDHLALQAKAKIEAEYMAKGYFLAKANPELKYSEDSTHADLTFKIKEFSKVKVETVYMTGSSRLNADDLVKQMSNRKHGFLRSSDFKKEKYSEDLVKIIEYCNTKGFVDAYIKSDSFVIDTARNRMSIYINIYEGPRYYFGEVEFSGNEIFGAEQLRKALKHGQGNVFDQEKYDESLGEIYGVYQEEGYLHVRILDERKTRDSTIDITYQIIEGLPSEIRMINIAGNTKTKEKVIRREMYVRPGDTFHRSLLMRSLREAMQLNYFADVVPDIRNLPSGDVDLIMKVEEKPTGQVSAGAGYSGQDKLVGTFGLGIPNFRGNGQNLSMNVDFGSRRNSVSVGFTEPWFLGTPTSVGGDIYNLNRRWYDDFTEGRRGGALRLGRRLRWPDNYFKVFWRYRLEDVKYFDFSDGFRGQSGDIVFDSDGNQSYIPNAGSLINFKEKWLRTSATSLTIERDSRDLPIFSTNGSRVSYTGEYAGGVLGGQWDYYKHLFIAQRFIPLGWNFAFVSKFRFGYISADNNDKIPYSERFSPGGVDPDGMVRGYPDASLSPRGPGGSFNRGTSEVIYNFELQFPLVDQQIYVLGFADAGAAWESKRDIKLFSGLARGAGIGFRLVVPGVGVIGFDFGYAFDEVYGESKGWKPHFQVGQGF
ncbi:MAG: outer membrane protein assembly factor BamA [Candidatus Zixiibacteriota bacterium]